MGFMQLNLKQGKTLHAGAKCATLKLNENTTDNIMAIECNNI